jgi:uncharacterized protein YndB with AHSA1/START domain
MTRDDVLSKVLGSRWSEGKLERLVARERKAGNWLAAGKIIYCQEEVDAAFVAAVTRQSTPGPRDLKIEMQEYDVRAGGSWAYIHRDPEGTPYGFSGVFHSVSPDRIVQTFEFDGYPGHVSLESVAFEDLGGRTRLRVHAVYQTVEDRDGMVESGMETGLTEGFERLDELLASAVRA